MRRKPTSAEPIRVVSVRHAWRGAYLAKWDDLANYPRALESLFTRDARGVWQSGEGNPSGLYGQPLRPAPRAVTEALDRAALGA